jgi:FMN-dependent NADH-azoreductase
MNILHLDSSIQGASSASRTIAAAAVEQLRADHLDATITYRDLVADPIAPLTLEALADPDANREVAEFLAADVVVIGAGMYNFAIPSQLKSWIDRIIVAGRTFRYEPTGPVGLAGGKRVLVALAKGGVYRDTPAAAIDHAESYLRDIFRFLGVDDLEIIAAEGLKVSDTVRDAAIAQAIGRAREAAASVPAFA